MFILAEKVREKRGFYEPLQIGGKEKKKKKKKKGRTLMMGSFSNEMYTLRKQQQEE